MDGWHVHYFKKERMLEKIGGHLGGITKEGPKQLQLAGGMN
jgi:hypothetical protein